MTRRRLASSAVAALGVAAVSAALGAPAAHAVPTTTTVPFRCSQAEFGSTYEWDGLQDIPVTVDAPADVPAGSDIDVTYTLPGATPKNGPFPLTGVTTRTKPKLLAAVAVKTGTNREGSGTGTVSGSTALPAYGGLPAPTPVDVHVSTAGLDAGDLVDLRVGVLQIEIVTADDGAAPGLLTCTPEPDQQPFASVLLAPAAEVPEGGVGLVVLAGLGALGAGCLLHRARGRRVSGGMR